MDAATLLRTATDPEQWVAASASLRRAGNALWSDFEVAWVKYGLEHGTYNRRRADEASAEALDYLQAAKLLYGYAIEAGLKAHLIRHYPGKIKIGLSADGSGTVQSAEIKEIGVSAGKGHDLCLLADHAGVFADQSPFSEESDRRAVREILKHLSDVVLWSGRYPVPLRSGEPTSMDPTVPPRVLGNYLRDWTDPLLDHLQGPSAPSDINDSVIRIDAIVKSMNNPDVEV